MSGAGANYDVIIAGGGLAGGLIALRLKAAHPGIRVLILEQGDRLGGVHTWSCFETDLAPATRAWLEPLFAHRWASYEVRFPKHRRTVETAYRSIPSERFAEVVSAALGPDAWTGVGVAEIADDHVRLTDGRRLYAPAVIDARGPTGAGPLVLGWQKFVGQEVELEAPHGLTGPIVMDATVDQLDGYRFLYSLPFSPTRLLIEDTRYSDGEALDRETIRGDIAAYAARQGWKVARVVREEDGVLPIALGGDIEAWWKATPTAAVGLRAALFHPVTGYSLPDAARLAEAIGSLRRLDTEMVRIAAESFSKGRWFARGYYRMLNRMLFRACAPEKRYVVLERFYRLPKPLIERFYAGEATFADKARILVGKPPVPVTAALRVLSETSVTEKA